MEELPCIEAPWVPSRLRYLNSILMEKSLNRKDSKPQAAEAVQKGRPRTPAPEEMTIFDQLFFIQQRLKVGKTLMNREDGFSYRSEESILDAVTPLLGEVRCVLYFRDEIIQVCQNYVYLKTTLTLANGLGEVIEVPGFAREDAFLPGRSQAQITGAASTYAHKYALKSLFGLSGEPVESECDPDAEAPTAKPAAEAEEAKDKTTPALPKETPAEAAKVLPVLDPRSLSWNKVVMKVARQGGTHTRQQYVDWIRKSYSISDNDMDLLLKQSGKVS